MNQVKGFLTRANALAAAGVLFLAALAAAIPIQKADALALTSRSLMVTSSVASDNTTAPDGSTYSGLAAGDSRNGAQVGHTYRFTSSSGSSNVDAITIQYCNHPFGWAAGNTCTAPNGFSASAWSGASVNVIQDPTGTPSTEAWPVTYTTNGNVGQVLTLTNASTAFSFASGVVYEIDFTDALVTGSDYFVNPTTAYFSAGGFAPTYFAHIATHNNATITYTSNATLDDTYVDDGTVTNNITQSISIYTRVQETLNFSVEGDEDQDGASVAEGLNCAPLTAPGNITMGDTNDALSTNQAYFGRSYFRLATNSTNGTTVYYSGTTLTSGANTITANATPLTSSPGSEQFGLAFIKADATANPNEIWEGEATALQALTDYQDNADGYTFLPGPSDPKPLATSTGIVNCETGGLEYIANIAVNTEAGIYTTKINYIASPRY